MDQATARIFDHQGLADAVKLSPPTHGIEVAETRQAHDGIVELISHITGGRK